MEIKMEIRDIDNNTIQNDSLTINSGDILLFKQTEYIPYILLSKYIDQIKKSLDIINEKRKNNSNEIIGLFVPQGLEIKVIKVAIKD